MYDSRKDLYDWLVNSDLAMNEEEIVSNEKKLHTLIPPHTSIKTYEDFVNNFSCDSIQTLAWMTKSETEGEKPKLSLIPIHIASMQYTPESKKEEE